MQKSYLFPTSDSFAESFATFQDSTTFQRLQKKYQLRPYYQKYKALRQVVLASSFFLNVFSIGTAFTCVFVFLKVVLPADQLAVAVAFIALAFIEALKRLTIPSFFKNYLQFGKLNFLQIGFIVFLMATSILLSFKGAKDVIQTLSVPVQLTDIDTVRKPYLDQLDQLDRDKELLKRQTWKGRLVSDARKQLSVIHSQEEQVRTAMLSAVQDAESTNKTKQQQHTRKTQVKGEHFAAAALILDLLLILAFYYLEYYDFRSLTEFSGQSMSGSSQSDDIVMTRSVTENNQLHKQKHRKNGVHIDNSNKRTVVRGFRVTHTGTGGNAMRYNAMSEASGRTQKDCQQCKVTFEPRTTWQKFCCSDCRKTYHAQKHGRTFEPGTYWRAKSGDLET